MLLRWVFLVCVFKKKLAQNNFARKALVGGTLNVVFSSKFCSSKAFYCLRNKTRL